MNLSWGMMVGRGARRRGIKGRKKWDNCNSIMNKIYLKNLDQPIDQWIDRLEKGDGQHILPLVGMDPEPPEHLPVTNTNGYGSLSAYISGNQLWVHTSMRGHYLEKYTTNVNNDCLWVMELWVIFLVSFLFTHSFIYFQIF